MDEATAPTVQLIYSLALEGYGTNRIGKVLNPEADIHYTAHIKCLSMYKGHINEDTQDR